MQCIHLINLLTVLDCSCSTCILYNIMIVCQCVYDRARAYRVCMHTIRGPITCRTFVAMKVGSIKMSID